MTKPIKEPMWEAKIKSTDWAAKLDALCSPIPREIAYEWQYRVVKALYNFDTVHTDHAVYQMRDHSREQLLASWRSTQPVGKSLPRKLAFLLTPPEL